MKPIDINGTRVILLPDEGPLVASESDATDVIGSTFGTGADLIAVPVSRLPVEFFDLATKLAGHVLQKFVTYQLRVAIVGDIDPYLTNSSALRAFVAESNRGQQVWFVPDEAALRAKLS